MTSGDLHNMYHMRPDRSGELCFETIARALVDAEKTGRISEEGRSELEGWRDMVAELGGDGEHYAEDPCAGFNGLDNWIADYVLGRLFDLHGTPPAVEQLEEAA